MAVCRRERMDSIKKPHFLTGAYATLKSYHVLCSASEKQGGTREDGVENTVRSAAVKCHVWRIHNFALDLIYDKTSV
ncbi:hypothetical protein CCHR01_17299 [Colletotrichum chrysophilum]|uniref:Uncharacterized protein n=1 Tax=Colletotrichum chrysophilum TaxID=1836956 RepID=A0AAD9A274_9PEZI|nr:hypothetical protein CCHR01_17299 [Colletotrichum chrysophilum]